MPLTILNVAYPLTRVGPDAVGGSEQILTSLDTALAEAGHRSIVVACEGSSTAGELVATPKWDGDLDEGAFFLSKPFTRHGLAEKVLQVFEST